jgi:hypothetical protein
MAHLTVPTKTNAARERIRLYSALVKKFFKWSGVVLYRNLSGKAHPFNWSLQQVNALAPVLVQNVLCVRSQSL